MATSTIFNDYLFHCSMVGQIMSGIPKPLTENQEANFLRLSNIHNDIGDRISPKQQELLDDYHKRFSGEGRALTPKQEETYQSLLKKKATPLKLSDNQLIDYGSLLERKNAKLTLTEGVKKILHRLTWEHLANRSKRLENKFLTKGTVVEERSLSAYSETIDALVMKNTKRKTNEFLSGECDVARYKIKDIKSSYSWHTFPLTSDIIPSSVYEWQLDGYMWLFNYQRSELVYCLVDTPFKLIDDEIRRLDWKHNIFTNEGNIREDNSEIIDLVVEVVSGLIYTFEGLEDYCQQSTQVNIEWFIGKFKEVPIEIRVKVFKHNREEKRIEQLKEMITLAREYMNGIVDEIGENAFILHEAKLQ